MAGIVLWCLVFSNTLPFNKYYEGTGVKSLRAKVAPVSCKHLLRVHAGSLSWLYICLQNVMPARVTPA